MPTTSKRREAGSNEIRALTQQQILERALKFANRPSYAAWLRLFGEAGAAVSSKAAPELPEVRRAAEWFQAALSDIAHERQTREQLEAWKQTALGVLPIPEYVIEGLQVRTAIRWRPPRQEFEAIETSIEPDWLLGFLTGNPDALLATALMWLLDPDKRSPNVHECGRGSQCELERFFLRNRKYCCSEHTQQMNRSTNSDRSKDRRARDKAIELLKARFPKSARDLVWAVKAPGLSAEELVERALAERAKASDPRRHDGR